MGQILTNISGSYLEAASFFFGSAITVTAGNQQFVFRSDGVSASVMGGAGFVSGTAGYSSGAFGTNTTGTANFDAVLNQFYNNGSTNLITLKHLVVGQQYGVQMFALDDRGGATNEQANFADPNDTGDMSATFAMGDNSYAIGTFTASATSQTIQENLLTGGIGNINAVVVRALSYTPSIAPTILTQPRSGTYLLNHTATLNVVADAAPSPAYQWKSGPIGGPYTNITNGAKYSGSSTPALSVSNVATNDALEFVVAITNAAGGLVSTPADLFVWKSSTSTPVIIACIGASDVSTPTPYGTPNWPVYIAPMLGSGYTIDNFGASGTTMIQNGNAPYWNTSQYVAATNSYPNIVIIMLGSNDSKPQNWADQTNYIPDYEQLIDQFRNLPTHPRIYVVTLLTAYGAGNYGITDPIVTGIITPWIRQIGFDEGLAVIDVNAATKNMPENFPDDIHPDIAGAQVVAETIFNGLMTAGETPPVLPKLSSAISGGRIDITWPPDHTGWRLEMQTNTISAGLGVNWVTVSGSTNVNQISIPISSNNVDAFSALPIRKLIYHLP
jgi:lysophospholipase L1-like esterase